MTRDESNFANSQPSRRLRFDTAEDAFDFARQGVEDSRRWLVARGWSIAQQYAEGHLGLHLLTLQVSGGSHTGILKFLLFAVPYPIPELETSVPHNIPENVSRADQVGLQLQNTSVLVFAGDTQHAEQIIPTRVWLESFEQGMQSAGNGLAVYAEYPINICSVFREGKVVAVTSTELEGSAINGLVESMPQIIERIRSVHTEVAGHCGESPLRDMLSRLRVTLLDANCLAFADEGLESQIEILHIAPCAINE